MSMGSDFSAMEWRTLDVALRHPCWVVKFVDVDADADSISGASLTQERVGEICKILNFVETDSEVRGIIFMGGGSPDFCTGMNLGEAGDMTSKNTGGRDFFSLLQQMQASSKALIACVQGKVTGGGVGWVAAMDHVLASPQATFTLTEALFGLAPVNIYPFLIQRMGMPAAKSMALTARTVTAEEAYTKGLVDQLESDPNLALRKLVPRIGALSEVAIAENKKFLNHFWSVAPSVGEIAGNTLSQLLARPETQERLRRFSEAQSDSA